MNTLLVQINSPSTTFVRFFSSTIQIKHNPKEGQISSSYTVLQTNFVNKVVKIYVRNTLMHWMHRGFRDTIKFYGNVLNLSCFQEQHLNTLQDITSCRVLLPCSQSWPLLLRKKSVFLTCVLLQEEKQLIQVIADQNLEVL